MEDLKKELNEVLEKYENTFNKSIDHSAGFDAIANNVESFSKLYEPFVNEIVAKSNEYVDIYEKDEIIALSQEIILKFTIFENYK